MSLIDAKGDHPKEYFYKISKDGKKLFYHRTAEGHKKIAKAKIPPEFIDRIKQFDQKVDHNWLADSKNNKKKITELETKLARLDILDLSPAQLERSKNILNDQINSMKQFDKYCIGKNNSDYEKRYKEEMRRHGGFKNYFREKWGNLKFKADDVNILINQGIIKTISDPKEEAKKKYKRWLVKNHPDKGGDTELCAQVIGAFTTLYPD